MVGTKYNIFAFVANYTDLYEPSYVFVLSVSYTTPFLKFLKSMALFNLIILMKKKKLQGVEPTHPA